MDNIKIGRMISVVLAVSFDVIFLYFAFNLGTTKEEAFGSFLMTSWMLMGSFVLSTPVLPYVVWKFVKQERPIFWTFSLIAALLPIILTFVGGL